MTAVDLLTAWAFSTIVGQAAPSHAETEDEGRDRLRAVAVIIVDECASRTDDAQGLAFCVTGQLAVSDHESDWKKAVGDGIERGDQNRSCGYGQLHLGVALCAEIGGDVRAMTKLQQNRIELSLGACKKAGHFGRLRAYASGRCDRGQKESRRMVHAWDRLYGEALGVIRAWKDAQS